MLWFVHWVVEYPDKDVLYKPTYVTCDVLYKLHWATVYPDNDVLYNDIWLFEYPDKDVL